MGDDADDFVDAWSELGLADAPPPQALHAQHADLKGLHLEQLVQRVRHRTHMLRSLAVSEWLGNSMTTATVGVGNLLTMNMVGLALSAYSSTRTLKRINQRICVLEEMDVMLAQIDEHMRQQADSHVRRLEGLQPDLDACLARGVALPTIARLIGVDESALAFWLRRRASGDAGEAAHALHDITAALTRDEADNDPELYVAASRSPPVRSAPASPAPALPPDFLS